MADQRKTIFTRFDFSGDEVLTAAILPDLNYMYIQNELGIAAEERALLPFEDNLTAIKEAEYIRGKMDMARYLLTSSDEAREILLQQAQEELLAKSRQERKG